MKLEQNYLTILYQIDVHINFFIRFFYPFFFVLPRHVTNCISISLGCTCHCQYSLDLGFLDPNSRVRRRSMKHGNPFDKLKRHEVLRVDIFLLLLHSHNGVYQ